jgi:hypothetical protein
MPWQPNIPQAPNRLSDSQLDLLQNFQAIQAWSTVNHSDIAAGANLGQHSYVTMFPQAVAPGVNQLGANNINLYIDNANVPRLVRGNDVAGAVPWLNRNLNTAPGYTYFPTGLVLAWSQGNFVIGTTNFNATAIVGFTTIFKVWIISYTGGVNIDANRAYTIVSINNPAAIQIRTSLRDSNLPDPGNDGAFIHILGTV